MNFLTMLISKETGKKLLQMIVPMIAGAVLDKVIEKINEEPKTKNSKGGN
ncbi:MAG: hypothetical protein JSS91_07590 [Bacteroidetes bacterium]|nr:hypothetical protein [Bacteroidota bacterium]